MTVIAANSDTADLGYGLDLVILEIGWQEIEDAGKIASFEERSDGRHSWLCIVGPIICRAQWFQQTIHEPTGIFKAFIGLSR